MKWEVDPVDGFKQLEKDVRKAMRIAISAGAAPVKAAAIAAAPSKLGSLKKSIRIRVQNYKGGTVWMAMIGASSSYKRQPPKKKAKKAARPRTRKAKSTFGKLLQAFKTRVAKASKAVKKTKFAKNLKKRLSKQPVPIRPARYQKITDQGASGIRGQHYLDRAFHSSWQAFQDRTFAKLREVLAQVISKRAG